MAQWLSLPILLFCIAFSCLADAAGTAAGTRTPSVEARYLQGQSCLTKADLPCALQALGGMDAASPYAAILQAQIAETQHDHDSAIRLLAPLQNSTGLMPQALRDLHFTLAQAYEDEKQPLRAVQHLSRAEIWLSQRDAILANQQHIWQILAGASREDLLAMRGESPNTTVQGWIDLALALQQPDDGIEVVKQWRTAYPDHPADKDLLQRLAAEKPKPLAPVAPKATRDAPVNKVALLLPIDIPALNRYAEAILAGFLAAKEDAEVQVYPTSGRQQDIAATYRLAVEQGARRIAGPLTREEVAALGDAGLVSVPTLAFNELDGAEPPPNLYMFGMPVEAEAEQIAQSAHGRGLKSATLVAADTPLAKRMQQAFVKRWLSLQGKIVQQRSFSDKGGMHALDNPAPGLPTDMLFLAADAEQAQQIRPFLDQNIPTYGVSHLYDGVLDNLLNAPLLSVHFIDMPWLIDTDNPDHARYRQAAAEFEPGEEQRWFAIGVDAWSILETLDQGSDDVHIDGLSGKITRQGHVYTRRLTPAQFRLDGVAAEPAP